MGHSSHSRIQKLTRIHSASCSRADALEGRSVVIDSALVGAERPAVGVLDAAAQRYWSTIGPLSRVARCARYGTGQSRQLNLYHRPALGSDLGVHVRGVRRVTWHNALAFGTQLPRRQQRARLPTAEPGLQCPPVWTGTTARFLASVKRKRLAPSDSRRSRPRTVHSPTASRRARTLRS